MSGAILIQGGRVIDPASGFEDIADILIEDGTITDIGNMLNADHAERVDADGKWVIPGLIDMRVVTGEPGHEHRETLESAGQAAAAGGVTSMVVMPQTDPVIDDMSLLSMVSNRGRETSAVRTYVAGALTKNLDGQAMTEIGLMSEAGAVFFSNGDAPIANARLMRRLLSYSATFNALIASRPLDISLSNGSCAHESDFSARLGLSAHPSAAERIALERDIALAELTGGRLLIDMISSADSVDVLRRARSRDMDIVASVSINHLALNEVDIGDYRTFAKLTPPLREERDREALIAGINDGLIDVIVSSHDPRPAGDKRRPFAEAETGAVGLEILLAAGLSLVDRGELDLMAFLKALTCNPADILGLPQGRLSEGAPADIAIIDPDLPWVCHADNLRSRSKNTPFDDRRFIGRVVGTFCGGQHIFELEA